MVRRTDPKEDIWQNVKDAKKRKQIQDRLAQRARRQRLRQANLDSNSSSASSRRAEQLVLPDPSSSPDSDSPAISDTGMSTALLDPSGASLIAWSTSDSSNVVDPSLRTGAIDFADLNSMNMASFAIPSPLAQPNHPFTVFSALYVNGEIQGLPCSTTYSSRTPPPTPSIPLPLHPTETQRLIVHPRWIDRLPFPRMRDSLIKLQGAVNEEEFVKDLFTMPSWTIMAGRACWDPRAWRIEKEWAEKWGWLMF